MEMNLFEIGINIFEEFIDVMFLTLYFGSKYKGGKKIACFVVSWAGLVAASTYINSLFIYEGVLCFIFFILDFLAAFLFLKGNIYLKLFMAGFMNCIAYYCAALAQLVPAALFGVSIEELFSMNSVRIVLTISAQLLHIIIFSILLKYKFKTIGSKKDAAVLIIMTIAVQAAMIGIMNAFLRYQDITVDLLLATLGVMAASFMTYYAFIKTENDIEKGVRLAALEQKEEYDRKYAKEINEMYARTCAMRHDLLHHFETVKGLLGEDSGKAKEYLQSVTDEQIRSIRPMIKTDNDYFDAIANAKLAVCDANGIKVTTRIQEGVFAELNNSEIASLFGNLFDNAIDASKNSKQKRIELDVQRQKGQISVFMRNTIDKSVLEGNRELKTTKANKELHGLGTKNIKRIVDKHNGIINYFEEDGYFCCDILM